MKMNVARAQLALAAILVLARVPAHAAPCSNVSTAGSWAYTYTGTVFTPNGPLPTASVGHYTQDAQGNVTGSQTRTVAGISGVEDISGILSVNKDCTATGTIEVLVNGQLQRTAVLALVYDSSGNHMRAIFQSLTLADGTTQVPVVLTIDANRVVPRD